MPNLQLQDDERIEISLTCEKFCTISEIQPSFGYWYLNFEVNTFYNLSVYHYNLHDKQVCIITGWAEPVEIS